MRIQKKVVKSANFAKKQFLSLIEIFSILRIKSRFRIFCVLSECGGLTAEDLADILQIGRASIRGHLGILEKEGIIAKTKNGNYSINRKNAAATAIASVLKNA